MRSTHLGGRWAARHRIGRATLLRPDGSEREARAFCLDDDGRVTVAVKVAPCTWVLQAIEPGALILERAEDAQALREALAHHAAQAAITAGSAEAGEVAA